MKTLFPADPLVALGELAVVVVFALIAIKARALDKGGFLTSVLVGYAIFLGGGWQWFVIIAAFFVLAVGATWYKYEYKKSIGSAQEKGGTRNWPNILANGGAAAVFGVAELIAGGSLFAVLYLGAMSAAAADTMATELGLLSKSRPRLITRFRETVSPGTSGGVTAMGFGGTVLASVVLGVIAASLGILKLPPIEVVLVTAAGGIVGSLADSVVGATVQRKSVCAVCGKSTESYHHCGTPSIRQSGLSSVDNNIVNLMATIAGAVGALLVFALVF